MQPGQIVSLWDMLDFNAKAFFESLQHVGALGSKIGTVREFNPNLSEVVLQEEDSNTLCRSIDTFASFFPKWSCRSLQLAQLESKKYL